MGMTAWGLLAAPLLAQAPAAPAEHAAVHIAPQAAETDIFSGFSALDESTMSAASGGQDTAIDISNLGVNIADNTGVVREVSADGSTTGQIANNTVQGNGGITTVFNNTGNGVVFQSNVNVNIFTGGQ